MNRKGQWVRGTTYFWTKAFCKSFHATKGGAKLNSTAVQKNTQQSMGGAWIRYQLDIKVTTSTHVKLDHLILFFTL